MNGWLLLGIFIMGGVAGIFTASLLWSASTDDPDRRSRI